ncbi:MAG: glycosyltransferase family 2 protein [Devosia sp.]
MRDVFARLSLGGARKVPTALRRTPLVSVVIPCYNYGRYLRQCVDSVRNNQPGIELDIVIVDDASTDDTRRIADELKTKYQGIRVLSHPVNLGHIATYNEGLAAAVGDYVLLLSADDLVTAGALSRSAALLDAEPGIGLVYGRAIDFYGEPPASRTGSPTWITWKGLDWLRGRCRLGYNVVPTPTAMMRTSVLRSVGGYRADLPHAGDFEMWLRAAAVSDVGFLYGVDQGLYRCHDKNMNSNMFASGTDLGQLIDLRQRMQSFEAVFAGVGGGLAEADELLAAARATLAKKALWTNNYAYARGKRNFPYAEFETFARKTVPDIMNSSAGRAYARRKRLGLLRMPLHPLWAPAAFAARLRQGVLQWRYQTIGV